MFERFTRAVREVVRRAVRLADDDQGGPVTEEHLLLALLEAGGAGAALLRAAGLTVDLDQVRGRLDAVRRRAGVSDAEAAALRELGVDVDEVLARVERSLGPGALRSRSRRERPFGGGFSPETKKALEVALRQAVELGDRQIGEEHLVLALLAGRGAVTEVLAAEGVTHATARAVIRPAS